MFYYAQIDENNICIGVSQLSGEIKLSSMILLDTYNSSLLGKRYINGMWEEIEQPEPSTSEPAMPVPTQEDIIKAEILLNQAAILENQRAQDAVMAEILLGQLEV